MNDQRSRILYVQKYPDGGAVTGLYDLISGLNTHIYEPIVLFFEPSFYYERFEAIGAKVITLTETPRPSPAANSHRDIAATLSRCSFLLADGYTSAKNLFTVVRKDLPKAKRLARLIKDQAINLVHTNDNLPADRAATMAALISGVPQVCHVRTLKKLSFVEKPLARAIKAFIYVSKAIEELYRSQGVPANKGQVVYDAFSQDPYETIDAEQVVKLRAEFRVGEEDCLISNVGRLDWWKGHDIFLQAIGEVVKSAPNTKALIVGAPIDTPQCKNYYQNLQNIVENLRLSNHVIFTGFRSDIPRIMVASDIIVHSASEPEPFGRVVVEGMSAGRPVIATAAGGVLEIIQDHVTGLLVPLKDPKSMAAAILRLLQDPTEAKKIGSRAKRVVKERFSVRNHIAVVEALYQKVFRESIC